jgi:hypothetical protein
MTADHDEALCRAVELAPTGDYADWDAIAKRCGRAASSLPIWTGRKHSATGSIRSAPRHRAAGRLKRERPAGFPPFLRSISSAVQ